MPNDKMSHSGGRQPKAYINEVNVDRGLMQYVGESFGYMGYGAGRAAMPKTMRTVKALEHVGKKAGK
jgi:hypothetical protein